MSEVSIETIEKFRRFYRAIESGEYSERIRIVRDEAIKSRQAWRHACESLSEVELVELIKGIILWGRSNRKGNGGSASPVIPLYEIFHRKFPESEPLLGKWIIENRKNPYDPFGTICCSSSSSWAEFKDCMEARAVDRENRKAQNQENIRVIKLRKNEIEREKYLRHLPKAIARGDLPAVKAITEKESSEGIMGPDGESLSEYASSLGQVAVASYLDSIGR